MTGIPHRISVPRDRADDLTATTSGSDGYHADLIINAPVDSVFAAVSSVAGLSGWWTTDTGTHGGLRPQLDCYEHCSAGWSYLMKSLASYAETGTGHPVSPSRGVRGE